MDDRYRECVNAGFPMGSRLCGICVGDVFGPEKTNAHRAIWGLPPLGDGVVQQPVPVPIQPTVSQRTPPAKLEGNPTFQQLPKPTQQKSGGCGSCGNKTPVPKMDGKGPGSQLVHIFKNKGMPACQNCYALAAHMDTWGVAGSREKREEIIADILPRAKKWMSEKRSWIHKIITLTGDAIEDAALRVAIGHYVDRAIDAAEQGYTIPIRNVTTPPPTFKKLNNKKLVDNSKQSISNLLFSSAIGQPKWTMGQHSTIERIPFDVEPIRNLIYHVYPADCQGLWKWNLDQLLQYISIFNGRRVVAIAVERLEDAEPVKEHLGGEVLEYMVFRNNSHVGEMVSFVPLLAQILSDDPNQITFRAHAKGVVRACKERAKASLIRDWTGMLYRTNLFDIATVQEHLESAAMTGACRKFGQFKKQSRQPTYSGSFYWFRNCFAFGRPWYRADGPRWGCESWPGLMFSEAETRCLFHDDTGSMYSQQYWDSTVGPAYRDWLLERGLPR